MREATHWPAIRFLYVVVIRIAYSFEFSVVSLESSVVSPQRSIIEAGLRTSTKYLAHTKPASKTLKTDNCGLTTYNPVSYTHLWSAYLNALRPTGTLVFVGLPPKPLTLPVLPLMAGQRHVAGSPIGSPWQMIEMLDVAARHGIKAQTERFAFDLSLIHI